MIHFHLHYKTDIEEQLAIEYYTNKNTISSSILCQTFDGENWTVSLETKEKFTLYYKYIVLKNGTPSLKEWGKPRFIEITHSLNTYLEDKWRARANEDNAFLSTAFTKSIFRRNLLKDKLVEKSKSNYNQITFRLHAGTIPSDLCFGICGNTKALGNWTTPILLDDSHFPTWDITLSIGETNFYLEYKYVIFDPKVGSIVAWEEGINRHCHFVFPDTSGICLIVTDENFKYGGNKWRGTGVAIPVFSLRSRQGLGIGEFQDLKFLIDWSKMIGLNMIQVLPVNDTIANKTWTDSYPYAAISVFALHPLYINLIKIAPLRNKADHKALQKLTTALNGLDKVDFDKVLEVKFSYLKNFLSGV
ncbi:MAG: 4-alpha-glucanotransferase [Saprospiraceae bacterium]|nr:4-alpha-glucanotransferase [Saprospiraceae bacterium]